VVGVPQSDFSSFSAAIPTCRTAWIPHLGRLLAQLRLAQSAAGSWSMGVDLHALITVRGLAFQYLLKVDELYGFKINKLKTQAMQYCNIQGTF